MTQRSREQPRSRDAFEEYVADSLRQVLRARFLPPTASRLSFFPLKASRLPVFTSGKVIYQAPSPTRIILGPWASPRRLVRGGESISAEESCGSDWVWDPVNLYAFPIKTRFRLASRSSIGLSAGKAEEKGKQSSRGNSALPSVRRCEAFWLGGPGRGPGLKTRRLVWPQWRRSPSSTAGRKAFVRGPAKKEALEVPDGVHDFQAEPQRPVLQHPVLRLLPCPHRDDHPGDLVHGKGGRGGRKGAMVGGGYSGAGSGTELVFEREGPLGGDGAGRPRRPSF